MSFLLRKEPERSWWPCCLFVDKKLDSPRIHRYASTPKITPHLEPHFFFIFNWATLVVFLSGDLLIMWWPGHDGGAWKRGVFWGGGHQRGHSWWHRERAAVSGFPRLRLSGCGAGRRRGEVHAALCLAYSLPLSCPCYWLTVFYINISGFLNVFICPSPSLCLSNSMSFSLPPASQELQVRHPTLST